MLRLKLYLVDERRNARYHVAIVPNEWFSGYLNTSCNLCGILVTRSHIPHASQVTTQVCFSLVEKLARVLPTNRRASKAKPKQTQITSDAQLKTALSFKRCFRWYFRSR